ncbi:MAG: hypothetical protein LUG49_05565 [Oscillospiraceae bacterium]|nr:hypothetical protein [Oscillospiraceae bacterium]
MTTLQIAGISVGVDNKYPLSQWNCEEHITVTSPIFTASATEKEVQEEYDRLKGEFNLADCESNILYRKVSVGMLRYDAFLLHAAVVAVDGEGYVFTAPGGTGKSTHANYWMQEFGDRAVLINGDKPIIRLMNDKFYVCGTPWRGKERLGCAEIVPLKAVCLLERGAENEIAPADADTTLDKIFQQILLPEEPELAMKQLDLLDRLIGAVPVYNLKCNMSQEAAFVAYQGINQL